MRAQMCIIMVLLFCEWVSEWTFSLLFPYCSLLSGFCERDAPTDKMCYWHTQTGGATIQNNLTLNIQSVSPPLFKKMGRGKRWWCLSNWTASALTRLRSIESEWDQREWGESEWESRFVRAHRRCIHLTHLYIKIITVPCDWHSVFLANSTLHTQSLIDPFQLQSINSIAIQVCLTVRSRVSCAPRSSSTSWPPPLLCYVCFVFHSLKIKAPFRIHQLWFW